MLNFGINRTSTEEIVEHLRGKMMRLAKERASLTHPDVIAVSQQLDLFFVQIQRNRLDRTDRFNRITDVWRYVDTIKQASKPAYRSHVRLRRFVTRPDHLNGSAYTKITDLFS